MATTIEELEKRRELAKLGGGEQRIAAHLQGRLPRAIAAVLSTPALRGSRHFVDIFRTLAGTQKIPVMRRTGRDHHGSCFCLLAGFTGFCGSLASAPPETLKV